MINKDLGVEFPRNRRLSSPKENKETKWGWNVGSCKHTRPNKNGTITDSQSPPLGINAPGYSILIIGYFFIFHTDHNIYY